MLNKATSTWLSMDWLNSGEHIWTEGVFIIDTTTHVPATRHNYVDDDKYNSLFGTVTKCALHYLIGLYSGNE